ncbi:MAG: IclR family transcriptional regulator [Oscillospiraceae bacterium]|nr:IclR family transcriptional regulator [Oscillospiraceae bacterium]
MTSVERAFLLVEELAREPREYTLTELSKALGWPKSTVHGLLSTLVQYRYAEQSEETGHYKLGIHFFELGVRVGRMWDIRSIAMPHMQRLNNTFGEMVQLGTEDRGQVLYLEKLDSLHLIRIVSEIGGRLPIHCTGLGKAILANMPEPKFKQIVRDRGLKGFTSNTITTLPELTKELAHIRERGYAIDDGEIMEGLRCIAAPIFDGRGQVRYAISVSGMMANMEGSQLNHMKKSIVAAAEAISKDIAKISI